MLDIPASFVISSRLSTLDSKDILRIIHLAQEKWKEGQIKNRMNKYSNTPIIGVGISNPQELSRVISSDIPVIHIQNDCKALQAVQKRHVRNSKFYSRVMMISTSSLWGLFGYTVMNTRLLKKGSDIVQLPIFENGNLPIPNYIIGGCTLTITVILSWITKRLLYNRIRNEYQHYENNGEFLLLRNDILYGKFRYFIQTVIPYCFIGLFIYHLKSMKRAH